MRVLLLAGVMALGAVAPALAEPDYGRVPNGHRPPPGECRAWFDGRPAGQQPPPTDCRSAYRTLVAGELRSAPSHYGQAHPELPWRSR